MKKVEEGRRKTCGAFRKRYRFSRIDWDELILNGRVMQERRTIAKISDNVIAHLLKLILSEDNVTMLVWG